MNEKLSNKILLQSTAVGAFGGFCLGASAGMFFKLDWIASGIAGMGIGSIFGHTSMIVLIQKPTQTRQSVNVSSYASETDYIKIMTHDADVSRGTFGKIPTDHKRLTILARGLIAGHPFTESQWTGGRQPFTVREFSQIRTALIKSQWAAWRNENYPQRGVIITSAGMAVMRYYATTPRDRRAAENLARAHGRV